MFIEGENRDGSPSLNLTIYLQVDEILNRTPKVAKMGIVNGSVIMIAIQMRESIYYKKHVTLYWYTKDNEYKYEYMSLNLFIIFFNRNFRYHQIMHPKPIKPDDFDYYE